MRTPPPRPLFSPRAPWLFAVLLALAHVVWALTATTGKGVAFDELAHIVAGQTYWRHHDFRLHPENGMLPQRLAALPTLLLPWKLPPPDDPGWIRGDLWRLGMRTFYALGNDTDFALLLARSAASLHALGIALLVFGWSRRCFGVPGAFTSLGLCVLCPTLLAHGPLATSDAAMAFWMLAATLAYWRFLESPDWRNALLSSACLGLAAVAKFSAVLLAPIWLALWLLHSLAPPPSGDPIAAGRGGRVAHAGRLFAATLAQVAGALAIIWLFYEGRAGPLGTTLPPGDYGRPWAEVLPLLGAKARVFTWLRDTGLLPDAYAYGLANVLAFQERVAFLNGAVSRTGFVAFFPYAFAVKTPLPLLLALLLAGVALLRRLRIHGMTTDSARGAWRPLAPLLVLLVVYWAASLTTRLNIGHRHLLPVYPPLFILAGAAGRWLWEHRKPGRLALGALLAWSAATACAIRPHYLAFFNAFAGGPAEGHRHLVDSSLDWGMDLPGLARWLQQHQRPDERVHLAYFGTGKPEYEGISPRWLPSLPIQQVPHPMVLHPGVYAISATMLQQPYSPYRGAWTLDYERRYQTLRGLEALARAWDQAGERPRDAEAYFTDGEAVRIWTDYAVLRFARLCHYLRERGPDAHVGYSILIYRLQQGELDAAVHGSMSELVTLIERARWRQHPE